MSNAIAICERNLRLSLRSLDALLLAIFLPCMILMTFTFLFGGAINVGNVDYINFVVPGVLVLATGYGAASSAVAINLDMEKGIIDRFRSMPISGAAILWGHVLSSVIRNLVSTAVCLGLAFIIGFRPEAGAVQWLLALGMLVCYMIAMTWLAIYFGLITKNAEAAGAFSFFALFIPYLSPAFVPIETMPNILEAFARLQPLTPIINTLRYKFVHGITGEYLAFAFLWILALALIGFACSMVAFRKKIS
jgi:ABC-2 type transport system permease protein